MFSVEITGPAKRDIKTNRNWWAENRSEEQANRWYDGVIEAMFALATDAEQHAFAIEPDLRAAQVRQVPFRLGRRPTHRILYAIRDSRVVVYRVRSARQDRLTPTELFE